MASSAVADVASSADIASVDTTGVAFPEKCDVPSNLVCDYDENPDYFDYDDPEDFDNYPDVRYMVLLNQIIMSSIMIIMDRMIVEYIV